MSFSRVPFENRVTDDGLGANLVNALARAVTLARRGFLRSHLLGTEIAGGGGEHNDRNISKGWGRVSFASETYTLEKSYGLVSSITKIGTGHVRVTLSEPMAEPFRVWAGGVLRHAYAVPNTSTTVDVFLRQAVADGGAPGGYKWEATDGGFAVDVKGEAAGDIKVSGSQWWPLLVWDDWFPFITLPRYSTLNTLIARMRSARDVFLHRHTEAGEHDDPLIPRGWAWVMPKIEEATVVYEVIAKHGIIDNVTRVGDGNVRVNLTETMEANAFAGFCPVGGEISQTAPQAGSGEIDPWGGHYVAGAVDGNEVVILMFGVGTPPAGRDGGFFVEVRGELAGS